MSVVLGIGISLLLILLAIAVLEVSWRRERRAQASMPRAVCVLLPTKKGLLLAVSRPGRQEQFGLPGGKVEPGETPEQAAIREVKEETGLEAFNLQEVYAGVCRGQRDYWCVAYLAEWRGQVQPEEGLIARWVEPVEVYRNGTPFADYNQRLFLKLLSTRRRDAA